MDGATIERELVVPSTNHHAALRPSRGAGVLAVMVRYCTPVMIPVAALVWVLDLYLLAALV
jgi:hypothetical protein